MPKKRKNYGYVAQAIRWEIIHTGLPLYRIAKQSGVQQAQLWHFMRRTRTITLDTADKLVRYFGLTFE